MALRFELLSASHPSAEHCINSVLTLSKFRVVRVFFRQLHLFWWLTEKRVLSLLPRKQPLHFCLLAPLWEGERAGQDCILRQKYRVNMRKIEMSLADPIEVCLF